MTCIFLLTLHIYLKCALINKNLITFYWRSSKWNFGFVFHVFFWGGGFVFCFQCVWGLGDSSEQFYHRCSSKCANPVASVISSRPPSGANSKKLQCIVMELVFCSWTPWRCAGESQDSTYETLDPYSKNLTGGGCDVLHFSQHLGDLDRMAEESRQEELHSICLLEQLNGNKCIKPHALNSWATDC